MKPDDIQDPLADLFLDSLWKYSRFYQETIEAQVRFCRILALDLFPELYEDDLTLDDMP